MAAVIFVETVADFDKHLDGSGLTVVHFSAQWAPQCRQMEAVLQELSKDTHVTANNVTFLQIEAESLPELSQKYGVTAVPTFVLFRNKHKVATVNGANAPELIKVVRSLAKVDDAVVYELARVEPASSNADDLHSRLKLLISAAPCVLFMKGTPKEPKCGFSRRIIEILDKFNTNYGSFDILSDEKVRQGLKEFSKWPTYPQLYVNGELVGGLDIVNELNESGELEAMLPKKSNLDDKLKSLVNRAPVMVFMKGDRKSPQCGFSKQLVAILNEVGVTYETFDILRDEEVRQGLKTYSNWPTYPQVYVTGELIGGLDIVKELKESGELFTTLQSSK